IESVFQRFGFLTIDTPAFESMKILNAKGGIGEDTKLVYEMKYEDLALRYDQTISLARYMAMHQNLPMPFRRYAIGKVWRREEPQRLRYREITQADIDIIGGRNAPTDAEVIACGAEAIGALGIDYIIKINSRKFMNSLFAKLGVGAELILPTMRVIDKLDKIGRDGVIEQLQKLGLSRDIVDKIDLVINMQGTNDDKISYIEKTIDDKEAVQEMRETLGLLALYQVKRDAIELDFSLMRGLDYYTGIVFEYKLADLNEKNSLGGGGRYDNLIGMFSGKSMPAVGVALGIDRILELLNFSSSPKQSYANLFIATINDKNYAYALGVANMFRANGIAVDINTASRNISNQLAYANSLNFKYAIIIGDSEEKEKTVKMRNLVDGNESTLSQKDALQVIKDSM
ncbi:MAG: histidine--tRNA ligase, partial [Candidatus Micrarchaeales archaeon]